MMFENEADYEAYNVHPQHVDFVENRWKKEVEQFLEI
ncbi:Dabb family protein [Paenibacillus lautus]